MTVILYIYIMCVCVCCVCVCVKDSYVCTYVCNGFYSSVINTAVSLKVYPSTTMTTMQGKSLNTTVNPTAATPTVSAAAPPIRNPELEFPATNYYELESRVHTDQWTIPFRQDESLAICLRAAIKMLHHDVAYSDEQCISFMERTLPDAFFKVSI